MKISHYLNSPAYAMGEAGLDLHSRPGMDENEGVAAVQPAASDSPPDCRIESVQVPFL